MLIALNLVPLPPEPTDPCDKEAVEDRPYTIQEVNRALAEILDAVAEQGVFQVRNLSLSEMATLPIHPTQNEE